MIDFEDPEGQRLTLVADSGKAEARAWDRSPVPAEHQIIGLGPITISIPEFKGTDRVLTEVMEMRKAREYAEGGIQIHVYEMGPGGPGAELHVAVEPSASPGRQGAGGVHHVAFRVPDDAQYEAWEKRLTELGVGSSGPVDRYYFRSLYFREPGGILFELATDGPGFAVDEPKESLGEKLALPALPRAPAPGDRGEPQAFVGRGQPTQATQAMNTAWKGSRSQSTSGEKSKPGMWPIRATCTLAGKDRHEKQDEAGAAARAGWPARAGRHAAQRLGRPGNRVQDTAPERAQPGRHHPQINLRRPEMIQARQNEKHRRISPAPSRRAVLIVIGAPSLRSESGAWRVAS